MRTDITGCACDFSQADCANEMVIGINNGEHAYVEVEQRAVVLDRDYPAAEP